MPRRTGHVGGQHEKPQTFGESAIQFDGCACRIIENQYADTMKTRIVRHECLHRTIERAHATVANRGILLTEKLPGCERRENHLALDAEKIEDGAALLAIERAERRVPLRSAQQSIAEGLHFGDSFGGVAQ